MAALLVAVRRAACTLARRGRPGSLARCSLRVGSLPAGARPWLLRPRCAAASYGSAPAAFARWVGVVLRARSRGRPPVHRLASCPCARRPPPGPLCGPGPYLVLRALVGALRAPGARRAGPARSSRAGLAGSCWGAFAPARGCWSVGVSARWLAARPSAPALPPPRLRAFASALAGVPCAPAAPVARAGWWRRCAPCPLAAARWAVIGASSQTTPRPAAGQTPRRPRQQGNRAVMPPPARRHGIPIFATPRK